MIKECTEKRYDFMLGIVPPRLFEPVDHRKCKIIGKIAPTYVAFFHASGRFYEGDPMTVEEFEAFKVEDLP